MKKFLTALLAALLALTAVCAAAETTLTPYAEVEDASLIESSDLLKLSLKNGYALATMDGTQITDSIYGSSIYCEKGWITVNRLSEDDYQTAGILNQEGEEVVPCKYGDIKLLNESWALAFTLKLANADNYDYTSFSSDDTYYLIDTVDIYFLPDAKCVTSLPRANYKDAKAFGEYINIEDRANGTVTTYDSAFNALGEVKDTYRDDLIPHYTTFTENGQRGLLDPEGNVVLPASYQYVDTTVKYGYYTVSTGDKYGLADLNGSVVVPAEYEQIQSGYSAAPNGFTSPYVVNGYVSVVKDGKLGYYSLEKGETCPPRYAKENLDNAGMCALFTDMAGNLNLLAGDGVETSLEGFARAYPLGCSGGLYYRVNDDDYHYGVVDWHGNEVLPLAYDSVELSASGKYLVVSTDYDAPAQIFEVSWTPDDAPAEADAPAEDAPAGETAADASPAAMLLDTAISLLQADAAANGPAVATLLQTVAGMVTGNDAVSELVNTAITLLNTNAAASGPAIVTLLQSVKALL